MKTLFPLFLFGLIVNLVGIFVLFAPPSWLVDAVNNATTPPQRKPLTDEAIYAMCDDFHGWSEWDGGEYQRLWLNLCRAIEAAHGIKE